VNIGYGNVVVAARVVAVVGATGAPVRRLREWARESGKLVDATQGRKTRSVIVSDSDHVILSAVQAETISLRLSAAGEVAE
jgi:extracellular matrix regulatory protein A